MSFRITNESLVAQIRDLSERLRKLESGQSSGNKWSGVCQSFGCVTLYSPKSDFGGAATVDVEYKIEPIWPNQAGYPGVRFTRTETNLATGAIVTTTTSVAV